MPIVFEPSKPDVRATKLRHRLPNVIEPGVARALETFGDDDVYFWFHILVAGLGIEPSNAGLWALCAAFAPARNSRASGARTGGPAGHYPNFFLNKYFFAATAPPAKTAAAAA